MGTPLQANEPGIPCTVCWGPLKPFGNGATPKVVMLTLTALLPGNNWDAALEPLLLTPHMLEQALLPCNYGILDGDFAWSLAWTPIATAIQVKHVLTDSDAFRASVASICLKGMASDINQPIFEFAMSGSASIDWSLAGL